MSTTFQAAVLGFVQGLTEFLPVSSTAHLILARAIFGYDGDRFGLSFDVACHVGTVLAVMVYFRREIAGMLRSVPRLFSAGDPEARLMWLLAVGTIPAAAAGVVFKRQIEALRTPAVAVVALALGALAFLAAERVGTKTRSDGTLTMMEAFWIGCGQALALIPGVSRSGATLTVALLLGLRREGAARFIFLLAIPAILGAAASEAPEILKAGLDAEGSRLFLVGVVVSAVVGYAAVKYFIRYLAHHSLDAFAWYRIGLAAVAAIWIWGARS